MRKTLFGRNRAARSTTEQVAATSAATNSGQNIRDQRCETQKEKDKVEITRNAQEEQKRTKKGNGFDRAKEKRRMISPRSQTMRADAVISQVTGMLSGRMPGIRHQMLEKAVIRNIWISQIITGLEEETGKRDRRIRHRLREIH